MKKAMGEKIMKKESIKTVWMQGLLLAAVVAVTVPVPDMAFAQLSTAVGNTQSGVFNPLLSLLSYGCYTIGGFMGIGGVMKLKAHSENPTNAPLAHGLGRCAAAAGFLAMPSVMGVLNTTASGTLSSTASFASFQL